MNGRMQFHAQRVDYNSALELLIVVDQGGDVFAPAKRFAAAPLTLVEQTDDSLPQPTIRMRKQEGQQLMDALWDAGMRPSQGSGSEGSLAATQRHLEDMRTLVFKEKP